MAQLSARGSTKIQKAKCVVVGDESCGKSALIATYSTSCFPTSGDAYTPFDKTAVHVQMNNSEIMNLEIWEAAAQDSYSKLRAISYSASDIFILCFSIASPPTFENIFRRWYLELAGICPTVPLILVGCKSDLRNNSTTIDTLAQHGLKPITARQGRRMADQISAKSYIECSSLSSYNLLEVFAEACRVVNIDRQLPKEYLTKSLPASHTTRFGSIKLSKNVTLPLEEVMESKSDLANTQETTTGKKKT